MNKNFNFHSCNIDLQNTPIEERLKSLSSDMFVRWCDAKSVIFSELRTRYNAAYPDAAADPALHSMQCINFMTRILNQDHILSATELFLLLFASCIHDIGMVSETKPYFRTVKQDHYEVVWKIIMQHDWIQLNQEERSIVGYLCRWHNSENWYKNCLSKLDSESCNGNIVRCGLLLSITHICDSYHRLVDIDFFK